VIVVLLTCYLAVLALFVWLKFIPFNLFWKLSPVIVLLGLLIGLFIPMGWGAPSGPALVLRNSVQIIPSVSGEVIDVPVQANVPVKAGDVLFRIDPTTYDSQVRAVQAQLKFAELRLAQFSELQRRDAGRGFDVQQHQAEADQLHAQLEGAKWNLDKTTVRAPADGYVTNLTLRKGARVTTQSPVMAFIDTSDTLFVAEIAQIYARYIQTGQPAEVTFKAFPGKVFSGRVEAVLQAISTGQAPTTGLAAMPAQIEAAPFIVRLRLDDKDVTPRLPAGTTAVAAVFTDRVTASHVIRKVLLRQTAILNYVNPF
jgi:multidrug resistance efflux pump